MIVIVVGMHRSGTSMTAHMLQQVGIDMGEDLLSGETHVQAHHEDRDFLELHKHALRSAGGIWYRPPNWPAIWRVMNDKGIAQDLYNLVCSRVESHMGSCWGWKDPRTSLFLRAYAQIFDVQNDYFDLWNKPDVRVVWCVRKEDDVVASLMQRNGKSAESWRRLCVRYRREIQRSLVGVDWPVYTLHFERVRTGKADSLREIKRLLWFLGMDGSDNSLARQAHAVVKY